MSTFTDMKEQLVRSREAYLATDFRLFDHRPQLAARLLAQWMIVFVKYKRMSILPLALLPGRRKLYLEWIDLAELYIKSLHAALTDLPGDRPRFSLN